MSDLFENPLAVLKKMPKEPAKVVRDGWNVRIEWQYKQREEIVRCRDCKHATISTMGVCKYCEMFVLPDTDGYGADPQVNLPLDFFCAWGERRERESAEVWNQWSADDVTCSEES